MAAIKDLRSFFFLHTTVSEVMENQKAKRNAGIFGRKTSAPVLCSTAVDDMAGSDFHR